MQTIVVIAILAVLISLLAVIVIVLWQHKRASSSDIKLIGEIAQVESKLDPEGTIIIGGELWRARSNSGDLISPSTRVRVIGFDDLLALVEVCD